MVTISVAKEKAQLRRGVKIQRWYKYISKGRDF